MQSKDTGKGAEEVKQAVSRVGGGKKDFVIIGAGDLADVIADTIVFGMNRKIAGYAVDRQYLKGDQYQGLPVRPYEEIEDWFPKERCAAVVGFLGTGMCGQRYEKYQELKKKGYEMENVIHPTASISKRCCLGDGNVFLQYTAAAEKSHIGNCNFFSPKAYVCHDVIVGNANYFAPGVSTTGYSEVGNHCFLGVNSAINNRVKAADYTFIGGGVFLTNSTKPYEVYHSERSIPDKSFPDRSGNMKIHHIGYWVRDIQKSRKKYEQIGFKVSQRTGSQEVQEDEKRNIKILFLENEADGCMVELIERLDEKKPSPVDFIQQGSAGNYSESIPYHICYEVDDIDRSVEELRRNHFVVINPKEATTKVLFHKAVVFLFHKAVGIIELLEK